MVEHRNLSDPGLQNNRLMHPNRTRRIVTPEREGRGRKGDGSTEKTFKKSRSSDSGAYSLRKVKRLRIVAGRQTQFIT